MSREYNCLKNEVDVVCSRCFDAKFNLVTQAHIEAAYLIVGGFLLPTEIIGLRLPKTLCSSSAEMNH